MVAYLCNISIKFQMVLNNDHFILLNYTLTLQHQDLLHYLLACDLFRHYIQSLNSTQFLNITCLLFLSACLAAAVALPLKAVTALLTSMYASR